MITNAIPLSPVPEPESYAMMIAGLGVVGLMMRRKAKTADDVIATPITCTTA
ncbi:MAG: PEP-CTERM sorting domain-containing protein [Pedobacter sp.]|nr:MAG: PEP-CTERM sorting domain-containing protein [Pedobacter sp.]